MSTLASQLDQKTAFPVPVPDRDTAAFWEGTARGELRVQRCGACGAWLWQPRPVCSTCQTPDPVWTEVSGDGKVVSWTVLRPPTLPAYAELVPFVVLLVELDQGVRMLGYLVGASGAILKTDGVAEGLRMGVRVKLRFHEQAGFQLPSWLIAG